MLHYINRIVVKHQFQGKDIYFTFEDKERFANAIIKLPELLDDDEITFFDENEAQYIVPFRLLKQRMQEGKLNFNFIKEDSDAGVFLISPWFESLNILLCLEKPVEMHFEDITEEELFDFDPIKEGIIKDRDHGLWAFHGLRKFRFNIENMNMFDLDLSGGAGLQYSAVLVFCKKDNVIIPEIRMEQIRAKKNQNNQFFVYVDTNILGGEFQGNTHRLQFFGRFEVTYSREAQPDNHVKYTFSFPVEMIMYNTVYYPDEQISCIPLDLNPVSIDFGTSSTCVAVKNGEEVSLLTLSSDKLEFKDSTVNRFENPTNLMIYRWERIYEQWKSEHKNLPHFAKGNREDEKHNRKEVGYDFGYTVKEILEDAQSEELNSVLTQLKMIPYQIEQGAQLKFNPFRRKTDVIKLVSSPSEETDKCFDPIAFYGYLLGRAINDPSKGKVYTKYEITYPVKFNAKVREKLRTSLEYGLKRSLPLPLREAKDLVSVQMQYSEPVAYMGAVCGRHLTLSDNKPELFAVFDFGGGTLDFSFGMFRPDYDEDFAIDIFGVGGSEKVGGENLISRISLWIYAEVQANKTEMINNEIPFEVPAGEKTPGGFPGKLLNKSGIAKANVYKINESFSRKIFENRITKDNPEAEIREVTLFTINDEAVNILISVDYSMLQDKLKGIIEKTVQEFKASMISIFERNQSVLDTYYGPFDVKKVHIYKSGNASRNKFVEEKMKEYFPDNDIQLIDEATGDNNRYAVTPKTAVAFGQLYLQEFVVNQPKDAPFKWFVYSVNRGNGSMVCKIHKNDDSKAWVKFGTIRGNEINIHYAETPKRNIKEDNFHTKMVQTKDRYESADFYIRIFAESAIEYCVCAEDNQPNDEAAINQDCIVPLKG